MVGVLLRSQTAECTVSEARGFARQGEFFLSFFPPYGGAAAAALRADNTMTLTDFILSLVRRAASFRPEEPGTSSKTSQTKTSQTETSQTISTTPAASSSSSSETRLTASSRPSRPPT
mmetsp:Transcript_16777/g.54612  ORF Transcript_16777/g.54612 Transcript_16777/m.54612 type:complete len:118 (-) Transcript_16777:531-884(-)